MSFKFEIKRIKISHKVLLIDRYNKRHVFNFDLSI